MDGDGETGGLRSLADEKFSNCHETVADSMADFAGVESSVDFFDIINGFE